MTLDPQESVPPEEPAPALGRRNLYAVSAASFLTDVSSEMILGLLPLYLHSGLGVRINVIGVIEGVAESLASVLKVFSGWLSDRLRLRKPLAVAGYGLSAMAKPFLLWATSWSGVALVRWVDRLGKGVRSAPRDALIADSIPRRRWGWAFGLHRAADTAGAVLGIGIALAVVLALGVGGADLSPETFRTVVLVALVPAFVAVAVLAVGARDVAPGLERRAPVGYRGLGRRYLSLLAIVALFDLGNPSDAFLVLRAAERGSGVAGILAMLMAMNGVYALTSTHAGSLTDRWGRAPLLIAGWSLYALLYLGLAAAASAAQVWLLVAGYGLYYGLVYGTLRALVADLVPAERRGIAYGTMAATLGLLDLPASVLAGLLWHGVGDWGGFGPSAPFLFGAATAAAAATTLAFWWRLTAPTPRSRT